MSHKSFICECKCIECLNGHHKDCPIYCREEDHDPVYTPVPTLRALPKLHRCQWRREERQMQPRKAVPTSTLQQMWPRVDAQPTQRARGTSVNKHDHISGRPRPYISTKWFHRAKHRQGGTALKLGDMLCPWHPGMTLFECKPLHEAVTIKVAEGDGDGDESVQERRDQ